MKPQVDPISAKPWGSHREALGLGASSYLLPGLTSSADDETWRWDLVAEGPFKASELNASEWV